MTRRVGFGAEDAQSAAIGSGPWDRRLEPGERIVWTGTSRLHLAWDPTSAVAILPAALVGGLYLHGQLTGMGYTAEELALPLIGPIVLEWFLLAVFLYLAAYMLFHSLTVPGLTRYALSDRRAFIFRRLPWPRLRSCRLDATTRIGYSGPWPGTIAFAGENVRFGDFRRTRPVGFRNLPDADHVHALVLAATERDGRGPGGRAGASAAQRYGRPEGRADMKGQQT